MSSDDTVVESIQCLVELSLSKFKRLHLLQSCGASKGGFPKEGALQQMLFVGLTSSLPACTDIVSEMSAILPDCGDGKQGELDFYVNTQYFYGIGLMREGGSFKEHKERFMAPVPGQLTTFFKPGEVFHSMDKELLHS